MKAAPPTALAARTPRHSPRDSHSAIRPSRPLAPRAGSPPRRSPTACATSGPEPVRWTCSAASDRRLVSAARHNRRMKLLRMTPGKGDLLLAEGDPEVAEDEERLVEEFRRQLDLGMWAAVPHEGRGGQREATMVRDFSEIPMGSERVIFFPQAAGG